MADDEGECEQGGDGNDHATTITLNDVEREVRDSEDRILERNKSEKLRSNASTAEDKGKETNERVEDEGRADKQANAQENNKGSTTNVESVAEITEEMAKVTATDEETRPNRRNERMMKDAKDNSGEEKLVSPKEGGKEIKDLTSKHNGMGAIETKNTSVSRYGPYRNPSSPGTPKRLQQRQEH